MKKLFLFSALFLVGCVEYIPYKELDGKILCDETKKCYKLEWQSGNGEAWRFLVPTKEGDDTIWRYIGRPQKDVD